MDNDFKWFMASVCVIICIFLISVGVSSYQENQIKIECIKAGKTLIKGDCK